MKAKFSRSIACIEENEVNFSIGTLEHLFDSTAKVDLDYCDLDSKRDQIMATIELVRSSLKVLESEVEDDYQKLLAWKLERENTPQISEVCDKALDMSEDRASMIREMR